MGEMADYYLDHAMDEMLMEGRSMNRFRPRWYYNPLPLDAWIRWKKGDPTKAFPDEEDEGFYENPMFREEKPMAKIIKSRVDRIILDPASPMTKDDRHLIITRSHKRPGSITLYTEGLAGNCAFTIPFGERAATLEALKELFKDECDT